MTEPTTQSTTQCTTPSLAAIIELVGPCIFPFLSLKDVFCSLQYASTEIRHVCINCRQVWVEFVRDYCLGQTTREQDALNTTNSGTNPGAESVVCLIAQPKAVLTRLDKVPNDVLFSMISGIVPATSITGSHHNETYWRLRNDIHDRVSPFIHVKVLRPLWWCDSWAYLRLDWSGQWGIFWRVKFDNDERINRPFLVELSASCLRNPLGGRIISEGQTRQRDIATIINRSGWCDFMLGAIDVRNFQGQKRFERLGNPVDLKVRYYNHDGWLKSGQHLDFLYLWPLRDNYDPCLTSAPLIVTDSSDPESTVEIRFIGDVTIVKSLNKIRKVTCEIKP